MGAFEAIGKYATVAMYAAGVGDFRAAVAILEDLQEAYGPHGIGIAALMWIDSSLHGAIPEEPLPDNVFFRPGVQIVKDDGTVDRVEVDLDSVPPEVAWAARMIAARAGWDKDNFTALLQSIPDGQDEVYLMSLLMCCVETAKARKLDPSIVVVRNGTLGQEPNHDR